MAASRTVWAALFLSAISHATAGQSTSPPDDAERREPTNDRIVPATLYFSNAGGIEEAVPFPETEGDITVVLICGIQRGNRDIRSINICFAPNDELSEFEHAFREGMPSLEVAGGRVNGRERVLWIPYSVEFIKQDEERHIRLYQNYGTESLLYGRDYSAPQRVMDGPARRLTFGCFSHLSRGPIWVSANIAVDGSAADVRALTESPEGCRQILENYVSGSSFIPAYHEGKPVPAATFQPFFRTR